VLDQVLDKMRPPGFSEATDEGGTVPIETPTGYVHDRRVVDGARAPAESLSTDGRRPGGRGTA
jgi:hypothetical protein